MAIATDRKPFYLTLMRKAIAPEMGGRRGDKVIACPECGQECWQTSASRKAAQLLAVRGYAVKQRCSGCPAMCSPQARG